MDAFEAHAAQLVDKKNRQLLGSSVFVTNSKGEDIYRHSAGYRSLLPDAPPLDSSALVSLVSAGKFITHLLCLHFVEQGLIDLDEPIYRIIPELKSLSAIQPSPSPPGYTLVPRRDDILVRHLLSNTSCIMSDSHDLHALWYEHEGIAESYPKDSPVPKIIQMFSAPLLHDPGEAWLYNHDVHFLQIVIERISGQRFIHAAQKCIFDRLGLHTATYLPYDREETESVMMQWVERGPPDGSSPGTLLGVKGIGGLTMSIDDFQTLLADLLSPSPKLFQSKETIENLVFSPALAADSPALASFRSQARDYAVAPVNIPPSTPPHRLPTEEPDQGEGQSTDDCLQVNYSLAGCMLVEGGDHGLQSPPGTLCWDGMPNVAWAVNRGEDKAMFFATQLLPEYDEVTLALMKDFFGCAWAAEFGDGSDRRL